VEPEAPAAAATAFADNRPEATAAVRPLDDYRNIWQRNLFNVSKDTLPAPQKEDALDKLAPARKDIGLKLVGTVAADNRRLSRAFIDHRSARQQAAYREGDRAGRVLIKKIMRNKVIIGTDNGDKLLTVENTETRQMAATRSAAQRAATIAAASSQTSKSLSPGARTRVFSLDREEVEASLADTDQILQEVQISPYMIADRPSGFRLGNIKADSVLAKMGLRNGVVITDVNGETITGPDQAARFFQTLKEGGDIAIKIKRRRRTIRIHLNIG
jgi:general secretion pathway protein C